MDFLSADLQLPSPIQALALPQAVAKSCKLYVKREDLIHPEYGGNKWRKLKYNIQQYKKGDYSVLVTFGGAFSNHIAATASCCKAYGIPTVGIIRGNIEDKDNPTLNKAKANGMSLVHVSRQDYKLKEESAAIKGILASCEKPFIVPEGGSNILALTGVNELMSEVRSQQSERFDYIIVSAGTGTTAAGIISESTTEQVVVMNALKNESLAATISSLLPETKDNWSVNQDYTYGGFAKAPKSLVTFINDSYEAYGLPLDPIYNAKAFSGMIALLEQDYFPKGAKILYLLTGGLQGITAYNYMNKGAILINQ